MSETGWVTILRDVLRYRCEHPGGGGQGDWVCADGIGYLLPGLALLLVQLLVGAVALLALARSHRSRAARRVLAACGGGSILVTAWAIGIAGGTDAVEAAAFPVAVGLLAATAVTAGAAAIVVDRARLAIALLASGAVLAVAAICVLPYLFSAAVLGAGACVAAALVTAGTAPRPDRRSAASVER